MRGIGLLRYNSFCQVPIIYEISDYKEVKVVFNDRTEKVFKSLELDLETSNLLFQRTNMIKHIEVKLDNIIR